MATGEIVERVVSSAYHRKDMWENFVGRYTAVSLKQFAGWLADLRVVNIASKPGDILIARAAKLLEQGSLVGMVHVVVMTRKAIDEYNGKLWRWAWIADDS